MARLLKPQPKSPSLNCFVFVWWRCARPCWVHRWLLLVSASIGILSVSCVLTVLDLGCGFLRSVSGKLVIKVRRWLRFQFWEERNEAKALRPLLYLPINLICSLESLIWKILVGFAAASLHRRIAACDTILIICHSIVQRLQWLQSRLQTCVKTSHYRRTTSTIFPIQRNYTPFWALTSSSSYFPCNLLPNSRYVGLTKYRLPHIS